MLKTSNLKSMAQILRDMKYPPVEEDTDKDEPGTQGDKEEYQKKRKEIANKFGVESCSALKDEEKRKACYAALDAAHVSDDEEEDEDGDPVGKNEEVEVDEKTYFNIKKFGPVKPVTSRSMYLFARKLYDWANENAGANKKELKAIAKKIEKENKLPDFKEMPELVQSMMTQEFGIKEEVEIDEKFAGWIAMYGGKKLEIKKSEADGIWPAKQLAIKHFKVPKSKQGLLAIKPAHEEVEVDEHKMGASDTTDMYALMVKGMKQVPGSPKQKETIRQINVIRKRIGLKPMKEDVDLSEETELDESLALQLKMAFSDAKIKMKSRGGKIVIAKRDKKKAMDTLTKVLPSRLKKYVDKAVGNFLVFEEVEEASTYRDKKYAKKKKGFTPQSQKKSRWGSGGYGTGEEEVEEGSELDKAITRLSDLKSTLRQRRAKEGEGLDDEWEADQEERIDDVEAKIRDLKKP